jgi:hypothetical protein
MLWFRIAVVCQGLLLDNQGDVLDAKSGDFCSLKKRICSAKKKKQPF